MTRRARLLVVDEERLRLIVREELAMLRGAQDPAPGLEAPAKPRRYYGGAGRLPYSVRPEHTFPCVYAAAIVEGDRVKIGATENVFRRVAELRYEQPVDVEMQLVALMRMEPDAAPGTHFVLERLVHKQLRHARIGKRGEWFRADDDKVKDFIETYRFKTLVEVLGG